MAMRGAPLLRFRLQLALALATAAFMIVPILVSVLAGVTENYFIGWRSGLTLRWLTTVWDLYQPTVWLSLRIALACVVVTAVIGVPAAYVLCRHASRATRLLEELLVLPVAVPGLATALALILTYGRWQALRTSWLFILIGHVLFTLPFMTRACLAVLSAINLDALEEAAATLGAGFAERFRTVVIPNAVPGIVAGALTVLTLSVGEFNLTWMLHTPLTQTLPVGLADSYASMRLEIASAYTLIFLLLLLPLLLGVQIVARRFVVSGR
jgi:putative spermidine/putrescine transport system permease protein